MKVTLQTADGQQRKYDNRLGGFEEGQAMPCLRCGMCCTHWQPQLGEEDVKAIIKGLGIPPRAAFEKYIYQHPQKADTYLLRRLKGACVFLRNRRRETRCAIHAFKPLACQEWTPSLARGECREGLTRRWGGRRLLRPAEMFGSPEEAAQFASILGLNPRASSSGG
ncbi:MAG: YkgJ family cysteine cluster protein [Dehalococcoidia bacterium]